MSGSGVEPPEIRRKIEMASIFCGHCARTHGSVAEVQACFGVAPESAPPAPASAMAVSFRVGRVATASAPIHTTYGDRPAIYQRGSAATATTSTEEAASPAQIKYLTDLIRKVGGQGLAKAVITTGVSVDDVAKLSKREASRLITVLKIQPARPGNPFETPAQEAHAVSNATPAASGSRIYSEIREVGHALTPGSNGHARYAVVEDGVTKFYRVDQPTSGRHAGRVFLQIQASDTLYPVRDPQRILSVLKEIAKDEKSAMQRYGAELGECGHCGRTLTDEQSRFDGIGPICKGKLGW